LLAVAELKAEAEAEAMEAVQESEELESIESRARDERDGVIRGWGGGGGPVREEADERLVD
jgi:hypothetical protein